jgi:hypothetical protein
MSERLAIVEPGLRSGKLPAWIAAQGPSGRRRLSRRRPRAGWLPVDQFLFASADEAALTALWDSAVRPGFARFS